jgi:hypothetical protein
MAIRAIIIGNENYHMAGSGGLVAKLDGTLSDAQQFQTWLLRMKSVEPAHITFCSDATRAQISVAFRDLVDAGQNSTEELYVFYSGHGFSYSDTPMKQKPADILVGSEFQSLRDSGDACLALSEIQYSLFQCLGPGNHYYFVDACRNRVNAKDVNPGGLGWRRNPSQLGEPSVFTLFSAERGNVAAVRSGFAPLVVEGLGGRGRAKRREGIEMWVSFDSLRNYLESSLSQKIDAEPWSGAGRIFRIDPIPNYRCTVEVTNAAPTDLFTATLQNAYHVVVGAPVQFQGKETLLLQPPDDYFVQVTHPQFVLKPSEPLLADLYDDCSLKFEKTPTPPGPASPISSSPLPAAETRIRLSMNAPPNTLVEVTNLRTGQAFAAQQNFREALQPGPYRVRLLEGGWTAVRDFLVLVDPHVADAHLDAELHRAYRYVARRDGMNISIGDRDPSEIRDSLLKLIPGQHDSARADFSESLGPVANQDLSLWLSILGASRILGAGDFSKLRGLPLASFDDVKQGDSPVYILVGLAGTEPGVEAAVLGAKLYNPFRTPAQPIGGVPGLYELRINTAPGLHIASLQLGKTAPFATVFYTLPNRATLLTVARDGVVGMRVHQFMLPLANLRQYLSPQEQAAQPYNLLEAIRFTTLAQKQASRLRALEPLASRDAAHDPKLMEDQNRWMDLLYGKWLDPIMALMAAYELARNAAKSEDIRKALGEALGNLRTYFKGLPDVEVIAKLAGQSYAEPDTLPLFLAGLQALGAPDKMMPVRLPANKLDYTGPWITWVGVD